MLHIVGVRGGTRCTWDAGSCTAQPAPRCRHLHERLGEAGVGVAHEAAGHLQHAHRRKQRGAVGDVLAEAPQRQRARVEGAAACALRHGCRDDSAQLSEGIPSQACCRVFRQAGCVQSRVRRQPDP